MRLRNLSAPRVCVRYTAPVICGCHELNNTCSTIESQAYSHESRSHAARSVVTHMYFATHTYTELYVGHELESLSSMLPLCTRRVSVLSCGEHLKTHSRASQGHVCSGKFASKLFDISKFRYTNSYYMWAQLCLYKVS